MDIITGHRGTSHVTSQNQRNVNMGMIGEESYILPVGGKLAATVTGGNEVTISDGVLLMQGCAASIGYGQSETVTLLFNNIINSHSLPRFYSCKWQMASGKFR